jgi:hypothetical protein
MQGKTEKRHEYKNHTKTTITSSLMSEEFSIMNSFLQNILSSKFSNVTASYPLKKSNTWLDKWILHYDNASSHIASSAKKFLANILHL